MSNATERRHQAQRSAEIKRAALALSREVKQFSACDLEFRMTGIYPKPNGRSGNPTPGLSKCLSVMVREGDLVIISSPRRMRIYAAARDGERITIKVPADKPVGDNEPFIRPLTPQELRQGRARPARAVRVNLEEPLWPEDRAQ